VYCEVYSHGTTGTYFFGNVKGCTVTVHAEQYKVMLETFLHTELHPRQQDLLWFQQDGATAHTAAISIQVFKTKFPGRLISRFGDITGSPDHVVPDYFLWGYIKSKVNETRSANIAD
jgi:hypothetical protein